MVNYVCAFRGRRDDYQVPLALAEHGMLDLFITDIYETESVKRVKTLLPSTWQQKIEFRAKQGLQPELVKCLWTTTIHEHIRHRLGYARGGTYATLDQQFSRAAASQAEKTKSNLFLYAPYAWEAFTKKYSHSLRKVLFQYHPHAEWEKRLLAADVKRFPFVEHSYKEEVGQDIAPHLRSRVNDCWKYADLIFCASSFTRETLIEAGAEVEKCMVIPYGIDLPQLNVTQRSSSFRALFVGSGVQRKGLHHLLLGWQRARLPKDSLLILVCRTLDPGIEALIKETNQVQLLRSVTSKQLQQLYATSSLFVMPSLVEGFGQVFLEALSAGCPVLGTKNTSLPDLGNSQNGVFLVDVGNIEQLSYQLETLSVQLMEQHSLSVSAKTCAAHHSWVKFRKALVQRL